MFRRLSKDAYFTLDLHSRTDDSQEAHEALLPSDSAAATKEYLCVIKEKLCK